MNIKPLSNEKRNHIMEILAKIPLLGGLTDEMIEKLILNFSEITVKKGDYIFHSGESPKDIYIILSGAVECYFHNKKVHEFHEGVSLAEAAVIGIQKFKSDAIAIEDCDLLVLPKLKLLKLFEDDKEIFSLLILNIARELARRISTMGDVLRECKS